MNSRVLTYLLTKQSCNNFNKLYINVGNAHVTETSY